MNNINYIEPCKVCGKMTDIRNNGTCSRICESQYDDLLIKGADSSLPTKEEYMASLPKFDDFVGIRFSKQEGNQREAALDRRARRAERARVVNEGFKQQ